MPFSWIERFDIGVGAMNDEHKVLIQKMNRVEALAESGADRPDLEHAIDDLGEYTVQHFSREEDYMASIGFPQLAAHKHVHASMLEKYEGFKSAFLAGDGALPDGFVHFLNFWLRAHICGIDKRYGEFATRQLRQAT